MPFFSKTIGLLLLFATLRSEAQDTTAQSRPGPGGKDSIDLIDVGLSVISPHRPFRQHGDGLKQTGKIYASLLPTLEYTQQTSFALSLIGNAAFYTAGGATNISNISGSVAYTQKSQLFIPIQTNIWTKDNKYNITSDWRYNKYPQETFGLGSLTQTANEYIIDYSYLRFYQTLYKTIATDFYLGAGYDLDYYWNFKEVNPPAGGTDLEQYGFTPKSVSSGITLNVLYDGRRNSINPEPGYYASIVYRPDFRFLGSDSSWQSLVIDARKYMHLRKGGKSILAFWTYDNFTLSGHPPYQLLPATAGDTYLNSGRGYIQGRFRGKDMLYLESEYRFPLLSNGLLGAVAFVNAQSFTTPGNNRFQGILPGYGAGIRIKLNKFSRTNIALDYGFGLHGSRGLFGNLGEIF